VSTDVAARPRFDLDAPWQLNGAVSIRPERFGALLYHFGTRRLSFLKSPALLAVVRALGEHPCARDACIACDIATDELPRFETALATLASSDMIVPVPSRGEL
jgi:mycofactocin biosynthesis protein MftB